MFGSMPTIRLLFCTAAMSLLSLVVPPQAHAVRFSSCGGELFAFESAEVNVVILPYFQSGSAPQQLDGLGSELSLLVKLETLYGALPYDRWGFVLLTGPKSECDPETIARDLLSSKSIRPGGRLIMVWGKLYQQDENVYVQTFAKSYRNPLPDEKAPLPEISLEVGDKSFTARIIGEEFAFPPEQLPIKVMNAVQDNFNKAAFLYDKPKLDSSKTPIPLEQFRKCDDCKGSLAFTVDGRDGNWIHVRDKSGKPGYLAAHLQEGASLNQRMPEVGFLQGLVGFLRYAPHVANEDPARRSAGMQVAEKALMEYSRREETAQEPETKAAALQLAGILEFAQDQKDSSQQFDEAYQLVPYSSDSRNLAAMFRLYHEYNSSAADVRPREVASDFVAAIALDPINSLALANLQSFYELLISHGTEAKVNPEFAMKPNEIQESLEKVKGIRQSLAAKMPSR
jgi:hypothetical protein